MVALDTAAAILVTLLSSRCSQGLRLSCNLTSVTSRCSRVLTSVPFVLMSIKGVKTFSFVPPGLGLLHFPPFVSGLLLVLISLLHCSLLKGTVNSTARKQCAPLNFLIQVGKSGI